VYNTKEFKRGYAEVLMEVYKSDFSQKLGEYVHQYKLSVEAINNKLMDMTPHELSQELMSKKFKLEADCKEYIFIPSYFISPHYIRIFNDFSSMLIFDMRRDAISRSKKAGEISNALSVISDKTRLEILRELVANTSYGKNLAAKLNLTTATISHHIEQLKSQNLIHEEKVKNIKYFSANADEIDKLLEEVKNYLYNK
jgi:DNA-binding transcriptional ArsR family regulator